jgi:hypothetical protein
MSKKLSKLVKLNSLSSKALRDAVKLTDLLHEVKAGASYTATVVDTLVEKRFIDIERCFDDLSISALAPLDDEEIQYDGSEARSFVRQNGQPVLAS